LEIIKIPNPILKEKSVDIEMGIDLSGLIDDMFEINQKFSGVGLAAPQIGQNINLFLIDYKNFKKVFINPKLTQISDEKITMEESCLSIPNYNIPIERYNSIRIDYYNKKFELISEYYRGFVARIIQHEFDHLNGILISDRKK
jgi:peptide deformylase